MLKFKPKFYWIVVLPTVLAALYFSFIATPVYRSTTTLLVENPAKETGGVSMFLSGGTGDSMTGAFLIKDFNDSWGEFKSLDQSLNLHEIWKHGDLISSYINWVKSDVAFYHYYKKHVETTIDKKSGIVTVDTYAYAPTDAHNIAQHILLDADKRINDINHKKDVDMSQEAQRQLAEAKQRLDTDNQAIAAFRKKTGYYKPDLDYAADLQTQTALGTSIAKAQADFSGVTSETPNNPLVAGLKQTIASYQHNNAIIARQRTQINGVAKAYDALESKRQLDMTMLEKAGTVAQESALSATSDHYYLNVISDPSSPNTAEFPEAIFDTLMVLVVTLVIYRFAFV